MLGVIVSLAMWMSERRREAAGPPTRAERRRYILRVARVTLLILCVLIAALVLDALGLPGAAAVAVGAVFGLLVLAFLAAAFGRGRPG